MSLFSKHIDKQIATYQRELIETHYAEVENMYKQIRGWRHDYRNHIQVMKAYAADGNLEAIQSYCDSKLDLTVFSNKLGNFWGGGREDILD